MEFKEKQVVTDEQIDAIARLFSSFNTASGSREFDHQGFARVLVKMHEARADFNQLVKILGFDLKRIKKEDDSIDWSLLKDGIKTRNELRSLNLQSALSELVREYEGYFEGAPESVALTRAKQTLAAPSTCNHIYEARAKDGSNSAYGPQIAVCKYCGNKPSPYQG